jgi:class 3 adenylate cyclase
LTQELPEPAVAVLFTDIEGSTNLGSRPGEEAAHEMLRARREPVRQQIEKHSGHEVQSLSDGLLRVVFGSAGRTAACACCPIPAYAVHTAAAITPFHPAAREALDV